MQCLITKHRKIFSIKEIAPYLKMSSLKKRGTGVGGEPPTFSPLEIFICLLFFLINVE